MEDKSKKKIYCIVGSCYEKAKWVMGRVDMCDEHRTQYNQWEESKHVFSRRGEK